MLAIHHPVLLVLLLAVVPIHHALYCHTNGSFHFSRNEFHWNNFSAILLNIKNEFIASSSLCHVRLTVDYNSYKNNYVTIQFGSPINHHNTHIEFGSTINFQKNNIRSIVSYIDYTCSSENSCDTIFLNQWAKPLLHSNENSLHRSFTSIWQNTHRPPNICSLKKATKECTSYLCFVVYDELKNLSYGKSQCADKSSTNPVYIHIKTQEASLNHYQCIKNHCTDQVIYNSILENIHTEKSWIDAIGLNLNESDRTILLQTIIIVGLLLLIGSVAFYLQTRQYRQGYRLTTAI